MNKNERKNRKMRHEKWEWEYATEIELNLYFASHFQRLFPIEWLLPNWNWLSVLLLWLVIMWLLEAYSTTLYTYINTI